MTPDQEKAIQAWLYKIEPPAKYNNISFETVCAVKALIKESAELKQVLQADNDALKKRELECADLRRKLEIALEALKRYQNMIPMNRLITQESANYEREYGLGCVANEALKQIQEEPKGSNLPDETI